MTIVYKYAFYPDAASREIIAAQSLGAHRYYCALLENELTHRARYREIRRQHDPELAALEEHLAPLEAIERPTKEQRLARKDLRAALKERRDAFAAILAPWDKELAERAGKPSKEARKGKSRSEVRAMMLPPHEQSRRNAAALDEMLDEGHCPEVWAQLQLADRERRERAKELRAECGISSGTYLAVEAAIAGALSTAQTDPRFPAWCDGQGARKVGAQLLRPGKLRITDRGPARPGSKGRRAVARKADVELDIMRDVTLRGRVVMNRPVPSDAVVSWAYVMPGDSHRKAELQLTLRTAEERRDTSAATGTARVTLASDLLDDGSLLVARIESADGIEDVTLPEKMVRRLSSRPSGLRAVRDMIFNAARYQWIELFRGTDNLPQWQRDMCARTKRRSDDDQEERFIHPTKWRGTWKLRRIADAWVERAGVDVPETWAAWKDERIRRGQDLYDDSRRTIRWATSRGMSEEQGCAFWLWSWAQKDRHLMELESNGRRKAIAWRRDVYSQLAARLSTQFAAVEVIKGDLASKAKRPPRGVELTPEEQEERGWRLVAAGYELASAIKQAMGERCNVVAATAAARKSEKGSEIAKARIIRRRKEAAKGAAE